MAKHEIACTDYQLDVLHSKSKFTLLLGGIGSGKSFIGALWVITLAIRYKNKKLKGIIAANTYTQLMLASVDTLVQLLELFGIPYKAVLSGSKKRIEFLGSKWYLYSLEKYNNIRGIEVDYVWIDEICYAKREAILVCKGRMRNGVAKERQMLGTSSPNGFNWAYDQFEGKDDPEADDFDKNRLIRATTKDNIYLPEGTYEDLLEDYGGEDSPLARQELFGEFVSLVEGSIYWGFDRNKSVIPLELDPNYPVYVGLDFNIDNMNAVYVQLKQGKMYCVQEVSLTYSNAGTYDMGSKILSDLKNYSIFIIPDSTGKNRSATSYNSESNLEILRDMGLRVLETRNPKIRSRQTTVNKHFTTGDLILGSKCLKTMKELETLNGRDKEGDVAHLSVGLGYVAWKLMPVKRKNLEPSQIQL